MNEFLIRRLALGLSKRRVAKLANINRTTLLNAERGKNITLKTYKKLDDFYRSLEENKNVDH
ncbi:MAG: helix-turn-helix transcriptional regulator [Phascolarctobacterium sp.]|nr:helix-turn-helix transcriptional regulator [Phascolarctobacterium sp.]